LTAVLRQDEQMAAAHNSLGALRLKQGDIDAGEREIRRALADRPDLALAHFNLALAYVALKDRKAALEEYNRLKKVDPKLADQFFQKYMKNR